MALVLYLHPLASFCQKVLIALHENGTAFEPRLVDLMDAGDSARFLDIWPLGKIPILRDEARDRTIPETTIIIEYLEQHHPGARPLLPEDPAARLEARLWDRFHDLHVQAPMQKIVTDRLRPEDEQDRRGVAEARATLRTAYAMLERRMADRRWAASDGFSLADCAAAPALFYAGIVEPFPPAHPHLAAYFDRLVERPSVRRVIEGARPYFPMFPFATMIPARFLAADKEAR
ncbi:glutathione S-transferase family protein [Plastoroseomonas hellenica]|uniref:glutathione S-transferase family protein n=1 Tax=Plastoroseomonas hellenica TaxID=2687306 RepID=UPI001BAE3258|nr:glutathione S-transferase family protein [Plastoroseomonas hellenica]MBR0647547.1 glutathione S-transferase family protein [Plastoroseomonas hellenica]